MQVRPIYVLGVLAVLSSLTLADTPEDSPAPPQHESAMQLFAVELSDDPHTYAAQRQRLRDDVVMQQAALVAILEGRFALVSSSMPVTLPGFEGAWQVASSHVADPPDEIQKSDPVVAKLWEILMELPPDELSGDIDDGDCGTSSEDEVVGLEETDPLEALEP